jgi:hypothetical protein
MGAATKRREIAQRGVADEHDVATAAAVAAVGPALRDVRLAAEGDGAVPTVAAPHLDAGSIVEHAGLGYS